MKKPKAIVIGLDAATWDLIAPWSEQGLLPNLTALTQGGASSRLSSILPPITPPAWTSFQTGKNPGKHGIFHFIESQPDSYALRYANAGSRRAKTLWRILNDAGFTCGTMNIPFTYPPEKLDGFQISGMDTPSEKSEFIHPPELRGELEGALGGKLQLDLRFLGFMSTDERRQAVLDEMAQLDGQWLKAALTLLEKRPCDVMMFVFMSIDTVQHYFWQYMDRTHYLHDPRAAEKFGDAVLRVYQRLDGAVGELLKKAVPDVNAFVVSDHGGGPTVDRVVYLNRYFAQLGLLNYRADDRSALKKLAQKVIRSSYNLLRSSLGSRAKSWLANKVPVLREKFEIAFTSFSQIDWTRTKAYCSEVLASPPNVWINLKGVKPSGIVEQSEYETLRDEIVEKLQALKDPRTGETIIKRIFKREEIIHGPFANEAPDLILDWWEASLYSTSPSFPEQTHEPAVEIKEHKPSEGSEWGGTHRRDGILIAHGTPFARGKRIEGAMLIDMAPTLLHLFGQPIPDDMDGRVLTEIFDPEYLAGHPVRTATSTGGTDTGSSQYSDEEAAKVEERLKALGYIE